MARQKKTEQTYRTFDLYPLHPFGAYASCATTPTAAVRILYRVVGTEPPEDPFVSIVHVVARPSDLPTEPPETHDLTAANPHVEAGPLLRANGWWIDSDYRGPDFAAIRVHLRTVCGWSDADITGATWKTILAVLREHEQPQAEQGPDLTDDELQVLHILEERGTLTTVKILAKTLTEREIFRSDTTIKKLIRRLLDCGLIERPRERNGVRLTRAGKACLSEP